jgi:hypothetical protein
VYLGVSSEECVSRGKFGGRVWEERGSISQIIVNTLAAKNKPSNDCSEKAITQYVKG